MKYSVAALSTLAVAVVAKPAFTNEAFDVQAGVPFTLTYSGCTGGCTIELKKGSDSKNLATVTTLTAAATGTSATVSLPTNLAKDQYAFYIKNNVDGTDNYSAQFSYGSGSASTSETTSAASATDASSTDTSATETETKTKTTASATETTTTETSTTLTKSTSAAVTSGNHNATATHGSNKTSSSAPAATTTGKSVPDSAAVRLASPIALVAGAIAAMVYLS